MSAHTQLVLIRHGQSEWNLKNQFTGWYDADLTEKGYAEALSAAENLKRHGITHFDQVYTSVLKRSIFTMWTIVKNMNLVWLPVQKAWQLNERHYGALQGLNKAETIAKYGEDQVKEWRRSYSTPPPSMSAHEIPQSEQDKYAQLGLTDIPLGESLEMTQQRVLPFWQSTLAPQLQAGKKLLVVAHGNSLRALIMQLEGISSQDITQLEIETGVPLVYDLDAHLKIVSKKVLAHE